MTAVKPVTVPGRTLETAEGVTFEMENTAGRNYFADRAVNQRTKQNKHVLTGF
jgi:hypothetical protein